MLTIRNLSKSYRYADARQNVLQGLDFDMGASSSVALLGESGSGKSTLLHLIAGLDRADGGEIYFNGQALHAAAEANDSEFLSTRIALHRSPALQLAGPRAVELAETSIERIAHLDLYSCFPSSVEVAAS